MVFCSNKNIFFFLFRKSLQNPENCFIEIILKYNSYRTRVITCNILHFYFAYVFRICVWRNLIAGINMIFDIIFAFKRINNFIKNIINSNKPTFGISYKFISKLRSRKFQIFIKFTFCIQNLVDYLLKSSGVIYFTFALFV